LLDRAAFVLARGGLVIFPTDTLYGLAADPRIPAAVERVFAIKGRPAGQPLPLIAASLAQVEQAFGEMTAATRLLAECFWPGPLTLVIDAGGRIAPAALGPDQTTAVRVPAHEVARGLSATLGFPIVSTSANRTGEPGAEEPDRAAGALGEGADLLLDAGRVDGGLPSTIVDARQKPPRLIRAGAIGFDLVRGAL
jgi:L-threonylcarbamoyladenylate synthase